MTKIAKEFNLKSIASAFKAIDTAIDRAQVQLDWEMDKAKTDYNTDPIMAAYTGCVTKRVKTALRKYVEGNTPVTFVVVKGQVGIEWASDDNGIELDKTDAANWFTTLPQENFMDWGAPKDEALIELTMLDELEKLVKKADKTDKKGEAKFKVLDPEVTRKIRNLIDVVHQEIATGSRINA